MVGVLWAGSKVGRVGRVGRFGVGRYVGVGGGGEGWAGR